MCFWKLQIYVMISEEIHKKEKSKLNKKHHLHMYSGPTV